jgi:GMP synthase (glutamine-hydrolysing)
MSPAHNRSSRSFGLDISHHHPSFLLQEIAWNLGGTVAKCERREYGFARVQINKFGSDRSTVDALFEGLGDEMEVRRTNFT